MRFYHLETLSRAFLQNKKPQKSRIFKDFGVICRYFYMICHEKYRNVPAKCREALIFKGFLVQRLHCREEHDVSDGRCVADQHDASVDTYSEAACRRKTYFDGVYEVSVHRMCFIVAGF